MKAKILLFLLLVSGVANSQVNRDDRKATLKTAKDHIKSKTQIDYKYVFINGSMQPSAQGVKVESQTYDTKGNIIIDIQYDDYGKISAKTVSKYDDRGNSIEDVVYNSDGTINTKVATTYRKDTVALVKVFNPNGTEKGAKYTMTAYWGDTIFVVDEYLQKDSSLIRELRYFYDKAGNLTYILIYRSADGKHIDLVQKDGWKYNEKNEMVEHDSYNIEYGNIDWAQAYKYDENGNVIEIELTGNNGTNNFIYKNDAKGNPVSAIKYDNSNNPVTLSKWTYTYYQ